MGHRRYGRSAIRGSADRAFTGREAAGVSSPCGCASTSEALAGGHAPVAGARLSSGARAEFLRFDEAVATCAEPVSRQGWDDAFLINVALDDHHCYPAFGHRIITERSAADGIAWSAPRASPLCGSGLEESARRPVDKLERAAS